MKDKEVILERIKTLYREALELKKTSRNFIIEILTAEGLTAATMKALDMSKTLQTAVFGAIVFLAMFLRWIYARKRLEEIRKEISELEEVILGVDPMPKRLDFETKIEIIQLVLAAVFTILLYLALYYSP